MTAPIFHAPFARQDILHETTMRRLETFLDLLAAEGGTAVLRVDLMVADTENLLLVRETCHGLLFLDGDLEVATAKPMTDVVHRAWGDLLVDLNADGDLAERASFYPLPWADRDFCKSMQTRFLSVFLTRDGYGAVAQEYIPSYLEAGWVETYCGAGLDPATRAEIMSIFAPPAGSAHVRLDQARRLASLQDLFAAILATQCDHDIEMSLAPLDPEDMLGA